jgi:hypothetical protein
MRSFIVKSLCSVRCLFFWLLLLLLSLHAQGLEVKALGQELLSKNPRQIITTRFSVVNGSGRAGEFEGRVILPAGWRMITPETPFELANNESTVRYISIYIPEGAPAGDYDIGYEVRNRQNPAIMDAYSLSVRVLPVIKLQLSVLDVPEYVISGNSYGVSYLIQNNGNAPIRVNYHINSSRNHVITPDSASLTLNAGETQQVKIQVKTDLLQKIEKERLSFSAEVENTDIAEKITSIIELLPRVTSFGGAYNMIPSSAKLSYVTRSAGENQTSGWQTEISGQGAYDEAGDSYISYLLRTPDLTEVSSLAEIDEYRFYYSGKQFDYSLGDRVYSLSPLTERGVYGRGLQAGYQTEQSKVKVYYTADKYSAEKKKQSAIYVDYQIKKDYRLGINYLNKQKGNLSEEIFSLRNQMQWSHSFNTDIEFAQSKGERESAQAVRIEQYDYRHALRYRFTLLYAEPEFLGSYRDQALASLNLNYLLNKKWALQGYYRNQQTNLNTAADRAAADDQNMGTGVTYRLSANSDISLDYDRQRKTDRRDNTEFSFSYDRWRLAVGQRFNNISLNVSGERGFYKDYFDQSSFTTERYRASAYWRATDQQTYSAYLAYNDTSRSIEEQNVQTTLGMNANYQISNYTSLSFNAEKSIVNERQRFAYNMSFRHTLSNGDQFSLTGRHNRGQTNDTNIMLSYTVPFALPISRKKNVATLSGRVYDKQTGNGVADVILNLSGIIAVSDADGDYRFPSVKFGAYYLSMKMPSGDISRVSLKKLPLSVEIGSQKKLDIPLSRSVTLGSCVVVYKAKELKLPSQDAFRQVDGIVKPVISDKELVPSHGLERILLTLRNKQHIYRRLTDLKGCIKVIGAPPGNWDISVKKDALPSGLTLKNERFSIKAKPGSKENVEFKLVPKVRRMKMLTPLKAG